MINFPTGKPHVSFSEIKAWKECAYRHKLIYIDKIDMFEPSPYLDFGTAVHEALEAYLKKEEWDTFDISISDQNISKKISQKFIADGLKAIDEIWGLEVGLILDGLYAGTADCIGLVNGIPSIIDFKTAKKIKRREWIEDYFLQGCAYANAHNVMFGTNISQIVILMVDRDLVFQAFTVKTAEFNVLTRKWKNKLIQFDTQKIKEKS